MIDIDLDADCVLDELSIGRDKSASAPIVHAAFTESPPSSSIVRVLAEIGPGSDPEAGALEVAAMPFPRTYTPPPTAPALQETCASSDKPPHFGITELNPAPNFPVERRCLAILGKAKAVVVLVGVLGDKVKARKRL
jgi:hypothetical protein